MASKAGENGDERLGAVLEPAQRAERRRKAEFQQMTLNAEQWTGKFGSRIADATRALFEEENGGVGRSGGDRSAKLGRDASDDELLDNQNGEVIYQDEDELAQHQRDDRSEVPLVQFNLKEEEGFGRFSDDGSFVWRNRQEDDDGIKDAWIDSLKTADTHDAHTAKKPKKPNESSVKASGKSRNRQELQRSEESDRSRNYYIQLLVNLLKDNETVVGGLARFGKTRDLESLEKATEAADAVLDSLTNVYSMSKSELDSVVKEDREKLMKRTMWQYRLSMDSAEIYGPFNSLDMDSWRSQGYFRTPGQAYLRKVENDFSPEIPREKKAKVDLQSELAADFDDDDGVKNDSDLSRHVVKSDSKWICSAEVNFADVF